MKRKTFESFENSSLFGKLKGKEISQAISSKTQGGQQTSTTLCKTSESSSDSDSASSQESLADPRCSGLADLRAE